MKIKKYFSYVSGLFVVFAFTACATSPKAAFIEFKVRDGDVQKEYYSEVVLKMTPDYEKRVLSVDYNRTFPNRTQKTTEPDVKIEGASVGGENFENFEKSVYSLVRQEGSDSAQIDTAKSVMKINMQDEAAKVYGIEVNWDSADGDSNYEGFKNFYLDVSELLTQDEAV